MSWDFFFINWYEQIYTIDMKKIILFDAGHFTNIKFVYVINQSIFCFNGFHLYMHMIINVAKKIGSNRNSNRFGI